MEGQKGLFQRPSKITACLLVFFFSLSLSQYDVINPSRIKCYFQIREVNVSYCVCMSLVSFLKWLLFVQVCCPTAKCPNLFVFLTQCVHPGRHFILNRPAVVCILNESWCKQRNVHFNFLHLFHRCTCRWQALIIHWNNTSQNVAIGDVTTWSRHKATLLKRSFLCLFFKLFNCCCCCCHCLARRVGRWFRVCKYMAGAWQRGKAVLETRLGLSIASHVHNALWSSLGVNTVPSWQW